jgi:hypothetical protein
MQEKHKSEVAEKAHPFAIMPQLKRVSGAPLTASEEWDQTLPFSCHS